MGSSESKRPPPEEYTYGGVESIEPNGFSTNTGGNINKPKQPLPDHEEIERRFAISLVSFSHY